MAYATAETVAGYTEVDEDVDLTPFIDTANMLVVEKCVPRGYTDAQLTVIESWLAAHFYRIRDQAAASESVEGVSESKQYHVGKGLETTMWGTNAMMADFKGGLAELNKQLMNGGKAKVGIFHLGKKCRT